MVITNFAPPMDSALGDRLVRLNGSAGPGWWWWRNAKNKLDLL